MKEYVRKVTVVETLGMMEVGETIALAFGAASGSHIRSAASILGMELDRKYSVHANRENRTYEVTRNE